MKKNYNKYKIIAKYKDVTVHVIDDVYLSTKAVAKDMVSILKMVNPNLTYKIEKIGEER